MLKRVCKFLSILILAFVCTANDAAANNIPNGNIGDFGTWTTEENHKMLMDSMRSDFNNFEPEFVKNQILPDYVPVEARVGVAFMNAMTHVASVVDSSLVRFAIIFILVMYAFWVGMEAYLAISQGQDTFAMGKNMLIKAIKIVFWIAVIRIGPAQLFMNIIAPLLWIGTHAADLILGAVASVTGTQLPDTCAAIQNYVATNVADNMILDPNAAANIICLPTRLSGFFTAGIVMGWKWMVAGIGTSAFAFVLGIGMIILFVINAWKFTLMALGVIADLFIGIFMLPFTAISETVSKTSYKGIPGTVYNSLTGIFKTESLKSQFDRFISATIYFVVLSVVIAVCVALLSGVITTDTAAQIPSLKNTGFVPVLLTAVLVAYLANRADEIAKDWGGSVSGTFGQKLAKRVTDDVIGATKAAYATGKKWYDIIREGTK